MPRRLRPPIAPASSLLLSLVLLGAGCGGSPASPDAGPGDAGRSDAGSPDAGPDAGPPEGWESFVAYQMEVGHIPGMAIARIDEGAVTWMGTYGYADVASETPVTEHTLFLMASISKTFTAMVAMQLVEDGALDLDAPADDYTDFPIRHPDFLDTPITPRMLLTHTSGIVDRLTVLGEGGSDGDPPGTLESFARDLLLEGGAYYHPDNFATEPGTAREYCNTCWGVLGAVLEAASARSASPATFREHSDARILEPLDLDGAGWFLADIDTALLATPHTYSRRVGFMPVIHQGFRYYPASSMHISLRGLSRYLIAIGNGGELEGARVLTPESVTAMRTVQDPALGPGQGLAWYQTQWEGRTYMGHSGSALGISTDMIYSDELRRGGIVLTNSNAGLDARIGQREGLDAIRDTLARLVRDEPGLPTP